MKTENYLIPDWPAPANIRAVCTTRSGGISSAPFDSFNLGAHVNDVPKAVLHNRQQLMTDLQLSHPIQFLYQINGTHTIDLAQATEFTADAAYTQQKLQICAVLTADCLPLLVTNKAGTEVAAIHAGWRGLLAGVIDEAINFFQAPRDELLVWLGPALGPCHFELNEEIYHAFVKKNPLNESVFSIHKQKFMSNFSKLAQINLNALGIQAIYDANLCSYCETSRFYSHRRDKGQTGRFASLIWLAE